MKVGILPGTFDPIHIGHIHLALSMIGERGLDRVLFVPTPLSPFKVHLPPVASANDRYCMVKIALSEIENVEVSDVEMDRQGPCYTIDLVRALQKNNSRDSYYLLLASDVLSGFSKWKDVSSLIKMAPPLIGQRPGCEHFDLDQFSKNDREIIEKGYTGTSLLEVSSTEIRNRLAKKACVDQLVPPKVLDYICDHRLYSPS
jgi:nicotinate-nucleotide adenylyltransferase